VSAFALDRYEVTVARFRRFWRVGAPDVPGSAIEYPGDSALAVSGSRAEPLVSATCTWSRAPADRESLPINCVNWTTAQAFCVWDGGRLPTEAEWELAARGEDGRIWPWGMSNDLSRVCGGVGAGFRGPCSVDDPAFARGASPLGAFHLLGNVWEWCADWSQEFRSSGDGCWNGSRRTDPVCSAEVGSYRVIRGGSWNGTTNTDYRATTRGAFTPGASDLGIGFRCARSH
jgi:formylglycine-generating enzyme required for sulfatase activity